MSEIVVMLVSKEPSDPYHNAKAYKRGDVVEVLPDGWQFGKEELKNAEWAIVALPNISVSEALCLVSPEIERDPQNASRVLQRREFYLDLEGLEFLPGKKTYFNWTYEQLRVRRKRKEPLADPNVL